MLSQSSSWEASASQWNVFQSLFAVAPSVFMAFFSPSHDVQEAPLVSSLWPFLLVHLLHSSVLALSVHYLLYCTPLPRLNQSLHGDWFLSWSQSEFQEEADDWRDQDEAVLLGLRKNDMLLLEAGFFWGCSNCCWDLSCWLMKIWMSSWGKVGRKRNWAARLRSRDSVWYPMIGKDNMLVLES